MKSLSSSKKHEKGQGLVEYALILVLVGIVVIGALTVLGPKVGQVFSDINGSIAGGGGGSVSSNTSGRATSAKDACVGNSSGTMVFPHPDGTWSTNAVETDSNGQLIGTNGAGVIC